MIECQVTFTTGSIAATPLVNLQNCRIMDIETPGNWQPDAIQLYGPSGHSFGPIPGLRFEDVEASQVVQVIRPRSGLVQLVKDRPDHTRSFVVIVTLEER